MSEEDPILAFFLALSPEARKDYDLLADRDRKYGEDVELERRETETQ